MKDITNQKFGRLTAIERTSKKDKNGAYLWLCSCDCGNTVEIPIGSLTSKRGTRSCGCLAKEAAKKIGKANIQNIAGTKFGRLTAIRNTNKKDNDKTGYIWECLCDCGNTIYRPINSLRFNNINSCGCLNSESSKKNISNIHKTVIKDDTSLQNIHNVINNKLMVTNKSGKTGVSYNKQRQCWTAQITFQKKTHYLGGFKNKQDAINARIHAEKILYSPTIKKYENILDAINDAKKKP